MKKKYLAVGSALVLSLSLCIYALNQHQVEGNNNNNRVSYVDGKQDSLKKQSPKHQIKLAKKKIFRQNKLS